MLWPPEGWEGVVLLTCTHLRRLTMTAPPDPDDRLICWDCRGANERRPVRFYDEWKPSETDLLRHLAVLEGTEHSDEDDPPAEAAP